MSRDAIIARIASGDEDAISELAASVSENKRRAPDGMQDAEADQRSRPHHLRTLGRGFQLPGRV